jgi:hypothetical protein
MSHRPVSSQPRRAGRGIAQTRRALIALGGLAVLLTSAIGLAPAASASLPSPGPAVPPPPPPPTSATAPAHLPLWSVVAIVAATVVLSVATTLITLAAERMRRARHTPAAAADPQPAAPNPSATPGPEARHGEILSSDQHVADHDMYRADRR